MLLTFCRYDDPRASNIKSTLNEISEELGDGSFLIREDFTSGLTD